MGGKGQKRREKNYLAAHGGDTRLPPPPKGKELDAIPSKLRRIMEFQNNANTAHKKEGNPGIRVVLLSLAENLKGGKNAVDKWYKRGGSDGKKDQKISDSNGQSELKPESTVEINEETDKKKKKRKKDMSMYLDDVADNPSKKKRKKEFLDARKKKKKKPKVEDIRDFPGREMVKFGEIVAAPPKLSFPKAFKSASGASKERLRLQSVEAYRNRKGWVSRPGMQLL